MNVLGEETPRGQAAVRRVIVEFWCHACYALIILKIGAKT